MSKMRYLVNAQLILTLILFSTGCATGPERIKAALFNSDLLNKIAGNIVVLEFRENGLPIETDIARLLRNYVQEQLITSKNLQVIANSQEVRSIVKAQDQLNNGMYRPEQIVAIGKFLGADFGLTGELKTVNEQHIKLTLKLFDLEKGTVLQSKNFEMNLSEIKTNSKFSTTQFPSSDFTDDLRTTSMDIAENFRMNQGSGKKLIYAQVDSVLKKAKIHNFIKDQLMSGFNGIVPIQTDKVLSDVNYKNEELLYKSFTPAIYKNEQLILLQTNHSITGKLFTLNVKLRFFSKNSG